MTGFQRLIHRSTNMKKNKLEFELISEDLFKGSLNVSPFHIAILDSDGTIIAVNQAWRDFAKANSLNINNLCEGVNYLDFCTDTKGINGDETTPFAIALKSVLNGQLQEFSLEYPCHSPNEERWFIGRINQVVISGKLGAIVIHENITQRKQTEATLKTTDENLQIAVTKYEKAENKFRNFIELAPDPIVIVNDNGEISLVNTQAEILFGYKRDELFDQKIEILIPQKFHSTPIQHRSGYNEPRTHSMGLNLELFALNKNGNKIPVEISLGSINTEEGLFTIATIRDITEKKRLESIAGSIDMMKNIGYIFSGIRHELGNPINSVKTALSVLKQSLDSYSPENVSTYIERSLSELSRVEYLLKSLKAFNMYENLKLERVNLVAFIKHFCLLAKKDTEAKSITLNIDYNSDEMFAFIDPRAFNQVTLNIFSNAIDALETRSDPKIDISLTLENKFVKIEISDNGIGLSNSEKEKLFKPFYTFKRHGTGLGLVITKKLINNMHGTIEIESTYNVGTKVILLLEKVD